MKTEPLITLTHREYQTLLRRQRIIPLVDLSVAEKRALERTRREMAHGDFVTLADLENELGSARRRPSAKKS